MRCHNSLRRKAPMEISNTHFLALPESMQKNIIAMLDECKSLREENSHLSALIDDAYEIIGYDDHRNNPNLVYQFIGKYLGRKAAQDTLKTPPKAPATSSGSEDQKT